MCFLCYEALSIDPVAPLPKGLKQRSRWSCPKPCSAVPRAGALWMAEYCSVRGAPRAWFGAWFSAASRAARVPSGFSILQRGTEPIAMAV